MDPVVFNGSHVITPKPFLRGNPESTLVRKKDKKSIMVILYLFLTIGEEVIP